MVREAAPKICKKLSFSSPLTPNPMKTITLKKTFIPDGWTIEEDNGQKTFTPEFKLHLEPEQENGYIKGTVLRERMKGKGMSAAVLDYLLGHTDLIPEEWKGKYIPFWGTRYRDRGGDLYVRCLYWSDGGWDWSLGWLGNDFGGSNPAAPPVSPSSSESSSRHLDSLALEGRVQKLEQTLEAIKQALV